MVLSSSQKVLNWMCVNPAPKNTTKWKKLSYFLCISLFFAINISSILAHGAYALTIGPDEAEKIFYLIFQIGIIIGITYVVIVALFLRNRFKSMFTNVTEIYKTYQNDESFQFVAEEDSRSERMYRIYFKYYLPTFAANMISSSFTSILMCWHNYGVIDTDKLFKPYTSVFPWNQHDLIGYFGEIIFDVFISETFNMADGAVMLLFISMCWLHRAFGKMFEFLLAKIDEFRSEKQTKRRLVDLIRFHITVKRWFIQSADIYSNIMLIELFYTVFSGSSIIFQIDLKLKRGEKEVFSLVFMVFIAYFRLFIYCYFGKMASESYERMAYSLFEFNWMGLPVKLQKYFILMINYAEEPVHYHGFGLIVLNLETYSKLFKMIVSYYLMFKTLAYH